MKALYHKSELRFSLIWIAAYVVLQSLADSASAQLGTAKIITAPLSVFLAVFLLCWIKKRDLAEKYGLCALKGSAKAYLYFFPLVLIASTNLWNGVTLNLSLLETALYVLSMLGVGVIEEIIFRGFFFKALCRENVKRAILISSITFGIGHIVNLLNGAELLPTLLQIGYACAIGFLFTIIFYKGKSLIPCIITHSVTNSLSVFAVQGTKNWDIFTAAVLIVASLGYALWIIRREKKQG